mmetsp:Transcript_46022/g.80922  ORF Transcript_46022/g.80922 Transcript_46022/m.80922 type:complete len:103 (-) Transcript_46022:2074-2382(-)
MVTILSDMGEPKCDASSAQGSTTSDTSLTLHPVLKVAPRNSFPCGKEFDTVPCIWPFRPKRNSPPLISMEMVSPVPYGSPNGWLHVASSAPGIFQYLWAVLA